MLFIKKLLYLFIIFAVSSLIAQAEFDFQSIKAYKTIFTDHKPPEHTREGEAVSLNQRDATIAVRSFYPYDPLVLGVVVKDSLGVERIAVGGEVDVLVDRSVQKIAPGEWIVTSGSIGRVMPLEDDFPLRAAVLGISLEPWNSADSSESVRIMLTPGEKITPKGRIESYK